MERRNTLAVVLLTFVTCGLYGLWWQYRSTRELAEATGRELSPGLDLLLTLFTLGGWGVWVGYRNAEIVHDAFRAAGEPHTDRSLPVLVFGLLTWVTGLSWLVLTGILQEDYNRLADAAIDARELAGGDEPWIGDAPLPSAY